MEKTNCHSYFAICSNGILDYTKGFIATPNSDFDPDYITEKLNIQPDKTRKMGAPRVTPSGKVHGVYPFSDWSACQQEKPALDVTRQCLNIVRKLKDKIPLLLEIKREFDVTFVINIVPHIYNEQSPAIMFEREIIEFCYMTGTEIGVDLYVYDREEILYKYVQPWELSAFTEMGYSNKLYKCESKQHGACMLKICCDTAEAKNQFNTLREYNGKRFCKVYNADMENGVLLIERIDYANILRCVDDLDERLNIFCKLFRGLHIEPADKSLYPTYLDWVSRITRYMRTRDDYKDLCVKMINAEEICRSLCEKYTGEMLLHGDLHHDNILIDKSGQTRIIDPKGVVGDSVFDIPRFILNEFDDNITDESHKKITHIIKTISSELDVDESDIRRLLYVETCIANCWFVEDGMTPDMDKVLLTEKLF